MTPVVDLITHDQRGLINRIYANTIESVYGGIFYLELHDMMLIAEILKAEDQLI